MQKNHHYKPNANKHIYPSVKDETDSDQEEIIVKNIQTGSTQNSRTLIQNQSSLIINDGINKSVWSEYFSSMKKVEDKLLELVVHRKSNQLEKLLTQLPLQLSKFRYMNGWGLLHFSVSQNDVQTALILLKFGIDPDLQSSEMQRSALHQSALANRTQLTKLLITTGANPNLQDVDRNTAIHFAVDYGYYQIVKIILSSLVPVDLNIRNCTNMTTFNTCRNPDIFQLLIAYGDKIPKSHSNHSKQTSTTQQSKGQIYQSRLRIRNSDVIPNTSRVDQVQKFLSLRETPNERKVSNSESIISEESLQQSFVNEEIKRVQKSKRQRQIGSYLKNNCIANSYRKASQNVGLMKESVFKTYLENEQQIQNYDKLKKIGEGAFAEVFLVRKKRSSSYFALKKIDKKLIIQNHLQKYVKAEKHVLTQVDHPFILKGYFCLQDFTHLFILMEFCMGGDLQKYVRDSPLSQSIAKTYVCEIALALDELHRNKILYRDLKVSNILVDSDGHLKLADFGLAKQAVSSDSFLGSVSYLPPQMLVEGKSKPHGKALDWYLLGVFLYQLLHGQPPFYDQERQIMQQKIKTQNPIYLIDVSKQARHVINRLLEKDPQKRLKSLEELKQEEWLNDIDWLKIASRQGEVMTIKEIDYKELRKKEYFQEQSLDKIIDEKIEWFQDWNYPKKL